MKRSALLAVILGVALTPPAQAQPSPQPGAPLETVIVTAPKLHSGVTPNAIAHDFVRSFATPTVLRDAIARWHTPICLEIRGMRPEFSVVVETRLRQIATAAGAPLARPGCKPNLSVTFTPEPQKLLDNIKAKNSAALGYRGATTMKQSIEAWYETGTTDIRGHTMPDQETFVAWTSIDPFDMAAFKYVSPTPIAQVEGLPGRSGLTSDFVSAFLIVDTRQTDNLMVESVADYIAMLALSRTEDYGDCQLIPSISNLLSPNCDDKLKPDAITPSDIAYLKGVYKMDPGADLQVQQNQIAAEMQKSLGGR